MTIRSGNYLFGPGMLNEGMPMLGGKYAIQVPPEEVNRSLKVLENTQSSEEPVMDIEHPKKNEIQDTDTASRDIANPVDEKRTFYPRIKNAVLLILVIVGLQTLFGFVVLPYFPTIGSFYIASIIVTIIVYVVVIQTALEKAGLQLKQVFSIGFFRYSLIAPVLITSIGLSFVLSEVTNLVQKLIPMNEFWIGYFNRLLPTDFVLVSLLRAVVIAPLFEEVLFRRIFIYGFMKNYKVIVAIVVATVMFGLIHFNPWQFIVAIALGLYLAWLYLQTKSVVPCILAHACYNTCSILATMVFELPIQGYSTYSTNGFQPLWFDLLGLALITIGVISSYLLLKVIKLENAKLDSGANY